MRHFSLKRYLPRSLYGRAALILLVPIVTIQIVVSFAFIQRLYEDVTVQMTQNMVPQIQLLEEAAAQSPQELQLRAERLGVTTRYPGPATETRIHFYDLSGRALLSTLQDRFPTLTGVDLVENRKAVHIGTRVNGQVLDMVFPRSRVSASNPHQLIVLMVVTAVLMTVIAYLFLRNQLRPIKRLADAAEAFGKGEVVSYQPTGANEVRSAGGAFLNMRSRIERQNQQRTLMLSGVSHDLRTPLTRLKLGLSMQPPSKDNDARYGSQARLSLELLEKSVRVTVEDDGPGIPEDKREEALKPFARLDASRNQNQGSGVGLGLSIAADIMRVHGGSLRLSKSAALGGLSAEMVLPR